MKTLIIVVALVAAVVGVGVWQFSGEGEPAGVASASPGDSAPVATASSVASGPGSDAVVADNAAVIGRTTDFAVLAAQANGADAAQRLQAIEALARAPRDQALPVLRGIATGGEPQFDKPAAVNALRELALGQGDKDGKVREAIREVLYHDDGQNPQLPAVAQDALDVVEESEMK